MTGEPPVDVALSLCELTDRFDAIEGALLSASSRNQTVTTASLASTSGLSEQVCVDILRQLRRADAVEPLHAGQGQYRIDSEVLRECFTVARQTAAAIEQYEARRPERTEITPLVTLPDDPSFDSATPETFEMDWLMPALLRMIKNATDEIVILSPFFEQDGFERLQESMFSALDESVEITIITRYLQDPDSHNRSVVQRFSDTCRDRGIPVENLRFVDYTKWDDSVPVTQQVQDGENPAFTLHAKIVLADREEAYLGSANVTDYGFERYLELGVKLEGPTVQSYAGLVDFMLDSEAATVCDI